MCCTIIPHLLLLLSFVPQTSCFYSFKMPLTPSPAKTAFCHVQWDRLNSLRLTAQETALLRMAETNPIDYTLADSRDASMYARVLLKLLAEASAGSTEAGAAALLGDTPTEEQVMAALESDPLGVVVHYALSKLHEIITTLNAGTSGVTVGAVFYVGKEGILVDQWKALLRILQKGGKGDPWAQKCAALCLAQILIVSCPSQRALHTVKDKDGKTRPISYASAMEPLDAVTGWIVSQLKNQTGLVGWIVYSCAIGTHGSDGNSSSLFAILWNQVSCSSTSCWSQGIYVQRVKLVNHRCSNFMSWPIACGT